MKTAALIVMLAGSVLAGSTGVVWRSSATGGIKDFSETADVSEFRSLGLWQTYNQDPAQQATWATLDGSKYHNAGAQTTATNRPTWSANYGGVLTFDGISDHVVIDDADSLNPSTGMTIMVWFRAPLDSNRVLVGKEGAADNRSYYIRTHASPPSRTLALQAVMSADGTTFNGYYTGNNVYTSNAWTHVAFVFAPTTTQFYVNGAAVSGSYLDGSQVASLYNNSAPLLIGARRVLLETFKGDIGSVKVSAAALSADAVARSYSNSLWRYRQ